jgi:hypothetical protein
MARSRVVPREKRFKSRFLIFWLLFLDSAWQTKRRIRIFWGLIKTCSQKRTKMTILVKKLNMVKYPYLGRNSKAMEIFIWVYSLTAHLQIYTIMMHSTGCLNELGHFPF